MILSRKFNYMIKWKLHLFDVAQKLGAASFTLLYFILALSSRFNIHGWCSVFQRNLYYTTTSSLTSKLWLTTEAVLINDNKRCINVSNEFLPSCILSVSYGFSRNLGLLLVLLSTFVEFLIYSPLKNFHCFESNRLNNVAQKKIDI